MINKIKIPLVDVKANYVVEMARSEVGKLSEVVVEFIPESNLNKFLTASF